MDWIQNKSILFVGAEEVAEAIGCSIGTVRKIASEGGEVLPGVRAHVISTGAGDRKQYRFSTYELRKAAGLI
jgi:hypothetical protein